MIKKIIKLTQSQYEELVKNGSITVDDVTYTYTNANFHIIPQPSYYETVDGVVMPASAGTLATQEWATENVGYTLPNGVIIAEKSVRVTEDVAVEGSENTYDTYETSITPSAVTINSNVLEDLNTHEIKLDPKNYVSLTHVGTQDKAAELQINSYGFYQLNDDLLGTTYKFPIEKIEDGGTETLATQEWTEQNITVNMVGFD